jgi:AhpC/TSA family/EF hand
MAFFGGGSQGRAGLRTAAAHRDHRSVIMWGGAHYWRTTLMNLGTAFLYRGLAVLAMSCLIVSGLKAQSSDSSVRPKEDGRPAAKPYNLFPPYILEPGYYAGLLDKGADRLKKVEAIEMLSAIVAGGDMGPNSAWFHPAQSRYSWKWLAERYDKNGDGKITPEEFSGPEKLFARLDRDGDGTITADDFDWTERSPYVRQLMSAGQMLRTLGGDNGGKITREDWEKTFERISQGKGFITPEDLRGRMFPPPARGPAGPPGGPTPMILLQGLLDGDIGSPFEGPNVGSRAPDFRLKTYDGKGQIALSDLRGKPVVLVFGSFT